MVRLGAGGLDGRALTPEAVATALQVLSKFRRLAESHKVDEIIAAATSATREAENGGEFLKTVAEQTGIRPRVISGTEEARLIHLAAVYGVNVSRDAAVVVDIGGGSVEVTRGVGANVELARSFKLGVIRLTERFVKGDPLEARDERKMLRYIDAEIGGLPRRDRRRRFRSRHRHIGNDPQFGVSRIRRRRPPTRSAPSESPGARETTASHPPAARRARSGKTASRSRTRAAARGSCRRGRGAAGCHPPAPWRLGNHAVRSVTARRARPRLHRTPQEGDRPGGSVSRRPSPQRVRAG